MSTQPEIEPINIKEYTAKQSKYKPVGKLPVRSIIFGPSGSGKTVLFQNMILDIYISRLIKSYICSPLIDVDCLWLASLQKYIGNDLKIRRTDDDPIYVDNDDPDALHEILDTQHKITEYTKKTN